MSGSTNPYFQLCVPSSPLRDAPADDATCTNECLFGERLISTSRVPVQTADDTYPRQATGDSGQQSQWLQVITKRDSYAGYIQKSHLHTVHSDTATPTHWVCSRSTLVFSTASIKSPVLHRLPFLSRITSTQPALLPFRPLDTGGFVWDQHLLEIDKTLAVSPLQLARSHFIGAPYLWGGCTPEGLDCSGLIQALAKAQGFDIPRDSGDQENALENDVSPGTRQRQDIIYWPGHTGILVDPDTLLHATAHSLSCVIEPLDAVVKRAGNISSIKRLFSRTTG